MGPRGLRGICADGSAIDCAGLSSILARCAVVSFRVRHPLPAVRVRSSARPLGGSCASLGVAHKTLGRRPKNKRVKGPTSSCPFTASRNAGGARCGAVLRHPRKAGSCRPVWVSFRRRNSAASWRITSAPSVRQIRLRFCEIACGLLAVFKIRGKQGRGRCAQTSAGFPQTSRGFRFPVCGYRFAVSGNVPAKRKEALLRLCSISACRIPSRAISFRARSAWLPAASAVLPAALLLPSLAGLRAEA